MKAFRLFIAASFFLASNLQAQQPATPATEVQNALKQKNLMK